MADPATRVMAASAAPKASTPSAADTQLRFAIKLAAEGLAVDERQDVVGAARGLLVLVGQDARIKQRQDVRVLQRGRGGDFLHEALGAEHEQPGRA